MSDPGSCEQTCPLAAVCAERERCVAVPGMLSLHEALCHFEREAVHGVCDPARHRLPYFSWGEGPPILFLHGVGATNRFFVPPISLLARQFRCVACELPPDPGDLFALLDHLGLKRSYVYGSGFGAAVGLAAMHARPERLPRAILENGFDWQRLSWGECVLAGVGRLLPGPVRWLPGWRGVMRRRHFQPFAARTPEMWQFLLDQAGAIPTPTLARQVLRLRLDVRPLLKEIRQPVLLLDGEQELLQKLPNARRVEIVGGGRFPCLTHPEVLAELVREFLTPPPEVRDRLSVKAPSYQPETESSGPPTQPGGAAGKLAGGPAGG
jgi:pimeloyl-ACP methyl ester carboxylesterase